MGPNPAEKGRTDVSRRSFVRLLATAAALIPSSHAIPQTPGSTASPLDHALSPFKPATVEAAVMTASDIAGGALITNTENIRASGVGINQIQMVAGPDGSLTAALFLRGRTLTKSTVKDGQLTEFMPLGDIPLDNTIYSIVIRSDQAGKRILVGGEDGNMAISSNGGESWSPVTWSNTQKPQSGRIVDSFHDKNSGKWLLAYGDDQGKESLFVTDGTEVKPMQYNGIIQGFSLGSYSGENATTMLNLGSIGSDGRPRESFGLTLYKPDYTNNTMTSENFNEITVNGTKRPLSSLNAATLCPDGRTIIAAQREEGNLIVFDRYTKNGYFAPISDLLNNSVQGLVDYDTRTMGIRAMTPEMINGKMRLTVQTVYSRIVNGEQNGYGGNGQFSVDPLNPDPRSLRASFVHQPFSSTIPGGVAKQKNMQMAQIDGRKVIVSNATYHNSNDGVAMLTLLGNDGAIDLASQPSVIGKVGQKAFKHTIGIVHNNSTTK